VPTYLQARKQCGLSSDFSSFEDLSSIFPQSYIDLLKSEYKYVEDIDLVVGGSLESFQKLEKDIVGETFDCIMKEQYKRLFLGDVYFFLNPASPYPFTASQLDVIKGFSFSHLVCSNSGVESVPKSSYHVPSNDNPNILCSSLKSINLDAWKIA
jgi:peroxidase